MEKIQGLDLADVGHKYVIRGMVLGDENQSYLMMFPKNQFLATNFRELILDTSEWEVLLKQMDTLQVEVTQGEHLPKVILRKSERNIEQKVSWEVYRRDGYKCRYCGVSDEPLTVDHLRLWEEGGPSIVRNLVSSCRKCNRTRGNTPYEEWLESDYYKKVSKNLDPQVVVDNQILVEKIKDIPLNTKKRKR